MKTYCVVKEMPFAKLGDEVSLNEDDPIVKQYVAEKKLLEKSDKGKGEAENELAQTSEFIAKDLLSRVVKDFGALVKSKGSPLNFSLPEDDPAQAKDKLTLGELLQAGAWSASPQFGSICQKGINLLTNKYKIFEQQIPNDIQVGKGFQQRWNESTKMNDEDGSISKAVQSEGQGSLGGFLVRPEFSATMFQLMDFESALVAQVTKRTMNALDYYEPSKDYSLVAAGASPYLAGMTGTWLAENQGFPTTSMNFRDIHLKASLFGAVTVVSRQLLFDNSYQFEQTMTSNFAKTAAFYLAKAIFAGTGAGQPKGFTNSTSAIARNRTAPAAGALLSDLATMVSQMMPDEGAQNRYFWMISPSVKAALIQLNDASGRVLFMPNQPNTAGGPATIRVPMTIFGMPVVVSQFPASSGSPTDIVLVDPSAYLLGLRAELEVAMSEHVNFMSNQHTYRFLMRADGTPALNSYLTLANGDIVSPFLYLN